MNELLLKPNSDETILSERLNPMSQASEKHPPGYANPPVVETVLGLQLERIAAFTNVGGKLYPEAFDPRKDDVTGLSVTRAKHKTIEQASIGVGLKGCYVAVLRTGDLKRHGITIEPRPHLSTGVFDPSHAELTGLNYGNRKSDRSIQLKRILAEELCLRVEGPFFPAGHT